MFWIIANVKYGKTIHKFSKISEIKCYQRKKYVETLCQNILLKNYLDVWFSKFSSCHHEIYIFYIFCCFYHHIFFLFQKCLRCCSTDAAKKKVFCVPSYFSSCVCLSVGRSKWKICWYGYDSEKEYVFIF